MTEIERHIDTLEKLIPEIEMDMNLFSYDRSALQAALQALRRTAEDDKAREEGPPCKVGDTLYTNMCVVGDYFRAKDKPYACKVVFIGIGDGDSYVNVVFDNGRMLQFFYGSFGKTVFLTRQEAEAALQDKYKDYPCRGHDCYDRGNFHGSCGECPLFGKAQAALGGGEGERK